MRVECIEYIPTKWKKAITKTYVEILFIISKKKISGHVFWWCFYTSPRVMVLYKCKKTVTKSGKRNTKKKVKNWTKKSKKRTLMKKKWRGKKLIFHMNIIYIFKISTAQRANTVKKGRQTTKMKTPLPYAMRPQVLAISSEIRVFSVAFFVQLFLSTLFVNIKENYTGDLYYRPYKHYFLKKKFWMWWL